MRIKLSFKIYKLITLTILYTLLAACSTSEKSENSNAKEAWLQKNFSADTTVSTTDNSKQSQLIELPNSPRFRDSILQGRVQNGMSLTEALAALRAKPYGTLEQKSSYWCNGEPAPQHQKQCFSQCGKCEAIVFGQHQLVMLEGVGNKLSVINFFPKGYSDFRASVDQSAHRFAQHIYQRKIVQGMPAGVVKLLINLGGYQTNYYCGSQAIPSESSCLGNSQCQRCKVELTSRSFSQKPKTVYLENHAGQQSVTQIDEH